MYIGVRKMAKGKEALKKNKDEWIDDELHDED